MEQLIEQYLQSGGSIKVLRPKTKRIFTLVPKKPVKEAVLTGAVKRVSFMRREYLKRLI